MYFEVRIRLKLCSLVEKQNKQVIFIGATNKPSLIDHEIQRVFKKDVYMGLPEAEDRLEILRVHTQEMKLARDVNLVELAQNTQTFSGADLERLVVEASMACAKELLQGDGTDSDCAMGADSFDDSKTCVRHQHFLAAAGLKDLFARRAKVEEISAVPVCQSTSVTPQQGPPPAPQAEEEPHVTDSDDLTLVLADLPPSMNERNIFDHFSAVDRLGKNSVDDIHLVRDLVSGKSTRIAYVTFKTEDFVSNALQLSGTQFQGQDVKVYSRQDFDNLSGTTAESAGRNPQSLRRKDNKSKGRIHDYNGTKKATTGENALLRTNVYLPWCFTFFVVAFCWFAFFLQVLLFALDPVNKDDHDAVVRSLRNRGRSDSAKIHMTIKLDELFEEPWDADAVRGELQRALSKEGIEAKVHVFVKKGSGGGQPSLKGDVRVDPTFASRTFVLKEKSFSISDISRQAQVQKANEKRKTVSEEKAEGEDPVKKLKMTRRAFIDICCDAREETENLRIQRKPRDPVTRLLGAGVGQTNDSSAAPCPPLKWKDLVDAGCIHDVWLSGTADFQSRPRQKLLNVIFDLWWERNPNEIEAWQPASNRFSLLERILIKPFQAVLGRWAMGLGVSVKSRGRGKDRVFRVVRQDPCVLPVEVEFMLSLVRNSASAFRPMDSVLAGGDDSKLERGSLLVQQVMTPLDLLACRDPMDFENSVDSLVYRVLSLLPDSQRPSEPLPRLRAVQENPQPEAPASSRKRPPPIDYDSTSTQWERYDDLTKGVWVGSLDPSRCLPFLWGPKGPISDSASDEVATASDTAGLQSAEVSDSFSTPDACSRMRKVIQGLRGRVGIELREQIEKAPVAKGEPAGKKRCRQGSKAEETLKQETACNKKGRKSGVARRSILILARKAILPRRQSFVPPRFFSPARPRCI
uniref:RRM domain-containing protein n=1 Tax=Chromera velia CCMP2878 TaxID=1169474 RepID=A0A0G4I5Y0_9ALVE|eukprot:Cvel_11262.t1-p1 / transcript=Cvel_11262.t1 / gene=Cvel_11262 / organism=Chromera_velia_CCMP2878 / gene_product=Cell division cycle protein 48 homolog, putative / transcript_product=Cell division cycle protein 48 homolog, putative / location=Cvel_scaffold702:26003-36635(+) / protein_length=915 / sequence_SO=supercontig / SO=protein_coding / is_pseudo=false